MEPASLDDLRRPFVSTRIVSVEEVLKLTLPKAIRGDRLSRYNQGAEGKLHSN